jgi:hypothetical protein
MNPGDWVKPLCWKQNELGVIIIRLNENVVSKRGDLVFHF